MYIVLWLEGPLQSWGHDSKFGVRETLPVPTKSGGLGMMLAALGKGGPQRDLLNRLSPLPHQVISYCSSIKMTDYQMIGSGYSSKGWQSLLIPRKRDGGFSVGGGSKILYKQYLQDARFAVAAAVPDDFQFAWVERIVSHQVLSLSGPVILKAMWRLCSGQLLRI